MEYIESQISDKWLKASVAGSIWAANEIILGSFLHNLRVPMTGTLMAFISVGILVSFSELWKERGIIWRASIIAALMKSISPSAIILGPMIGILMEGMLLSLGILALGRNKAGYALGGALAVLAVLFQKLAMLLITYGLNFVEIINNLFLYAANQLRFSPDKGIILIILLLAIHASAGVVGAWLGLYNGRNANKIISGKLTEESHSGMTHLFKRTEKVSYSFYLLLIHFVILISGLFFLNYGSIYLVVLFILSYSVFVMAYYKSAVKRLKKPSFWIWFISITFLASYFLGTSNSDGGFNTAGLIEGLLMNLRAVLIVMAFASISTELKNPVIKAILYKRGAAQLYQGLELAFGILPFILSSFPEGRKVIKKPYKHIVALIARADDFLHQIREHNRLKSKVMIITGGIQKGKTTRIKEIIGRLNSREIEITGFYTEVIIEGAERKGYRLIPLNRNSKPEILCSTEVDPDSLNYGKFYFRQPALELGRQILNDSIKGGASLTIIDEIGPLEMSGKGWAESIEALCSGTGIPMIWVVRNHLARKAARKWILGDTWIINIEDPESEKMIEEVLPILLS